MSMPKTPAQRWVPIAILLGIIGSMAVVTWWQMRAPGAADATDALADAPAAAPSATDGPVDPASSRPPMVPAMPAATDHSEQMSDEQLRAQLVNALDELDRDFQQEPRSAAWSNSTEGVIAASLSEAGLAANGAPEPIAHDAECRTSTCRIRVTYRNEMDAQMGEVFLLGDIARQLPAADFGRLVAADGTVQLVMYANTGSARRNPPASH